MASDPPARPRSVEGRVAGHRTADVRVAVRDDLILGIPLQVGHGDVGRRDRDGLLVVGFVGLGQDVRRVGDEHQVLGPLRKYAQVPGVDLPVVVMTWSGIDRDRNPPGERCSAR